MNLLALSNGHGEDQVAVRVLRQLRQQCPHWNLQALPLVGEGTAYQQANIPLYGVVQGAMPSGGFIYMDQRALLRDIRSGLLALTLTQLRQVRQWAAAGGIILAVGDIVPLLFAWWSGAPYAFIGTAKSEYYLRTDDSALQASTLRWPWHRWLDCVYLPWERSLLQHPRCKAVFPRDHLTAQFLQQWPIPVFDLGNPMMDDLEPKNKLTRDQLPAHTATILLLPGSRPPEAYENWAFILEGITPLAVQGERLVFIAAIAPLIDIEQLKQPATALGWQVDEPFQSNLCLRLHYAHMLIVKQAFNDGLHLADLAIATAGTATEQCVGLGKPIITLPGNGPQFTWAFAEAQSRLLGPSIHLLTNRGAIAPTVLELTRHSQRQSFYQQNGRQRMGSAGAALRITQQLQLLFSSSRPLRKT